jgi:glycolate oxidase FAD binding subunit
LRFGGLRDFVLCVRFVDGAGRLLMLGGKVVKNAAGFDLPKFFVGSLGRFGVLAELTFKVFPQPAARLTLKLKAGAMADATQILIEAAGARWEAEALDVAASAADVFLRLAGPAAALQPMAKEILSRWPGEILSAAAAETFWGDLAEFRWAHGQGVLVKVALTANLAPALEKALCGLKGARLHLSAGGNLAFISLESSAQAGQLGERLSGLDLAGLTLRGDAPLWLGKRSRPAVATAVKQALDPENRFPSLDE